MLKRALQTKHSLWKKKKAQLNTSLYTHISIVYCLSPQAERKRDRETGKYTETIGDRNRERKKEGERSEGGTGREGERRERTTEREGERREKERGGREQRGKRGSQREREVLKC